jgi:hypothetical protein
MRASHLLAAVAAAALALPVLAQNAAAPTQPAPAPAPAPAVQPQPAPVGRADAVGESATGVVELELEEQEPPPPPVEYPDFARRDPRVVGRLDPVALGLGAYPWRGASGAFLSTLMRRADTPLASRWAHIALRNLLIARVPAPRNVNPVDWAAERAWLLLRMGEGGGARMLVAGVDTDRFTPKMYQVAVQSALANADRPPSARFRAESSGSSGTSCSSSMRCAPRSRGSRRRRPPRWTRLAAAAGCAESISSLHRRSSAPGRTPAAPSPSSGTRSTASTPGGSVSRPRPA